MPQKNLVPAGHRLVPIGGKLRAIPVSGNRTQIASHDVGVTLGETANIVATPVMMLGEALMGAGRVIRDSQMGQSAKYGWDRAERRKVVYRTGRSYRDCSTVDLQRVLIDEFHWDAKDVCALSETALRKTLADLSVADSYIDEDTYHGQVLETVPVKSNRQAAEEIEEPSFAMAGA